MEGRGGRGAREGAHAGGKGRMQEGFSRALVR